MGLEDSKDVNLIPEGSYYGAWQTEMGDYCIIAGTVSCYLLIGEEKAMLIDTAYGLGNLRAFVEKITTLPLIVVNTHGHLDHSGGNGFWQEVWMAPESRKDAKSLENLSKMPYPDYEIHTITDGQVFDLGGRTVEAICIGAHHPGSVAYLDHKNRTLYTGDEAEAGQVLLFCSGQEIAEMEIVKRHKANMEKLLKRENEFDRLMPAHNGLPLSTTYLREFCELSEKLLAGELTPEITVAGFGMPTFLWGGDEKLMRIRYKRASFILSKKEE